MNRIAEKQSVSLPAARRWRTKVMAWTLVLLSGVCVGQAAPRPMYFDRYDRESGLSQLAVNAIAQDAEGFLWVGTEDGLDRFDGYVFSHFSGESGKGRALSSSFVADLQTDARGVLWVATDGGEVARRDSLQGGFWPIVPFDALAKAGLQHPRVTHFDHQGRLWIGTRNEGLVRFDPQTRRIERLRHDPGNLRSLDSDSIYSIVEDPGLSIWIGTASGLNRWDERGGQFVPQRLPWNGPVTVRALFADTKGSLWIGTDAGLAAFQIASGRWTLYTNDSSNSRSLPGDRVNTILEDRDGRLWVGTANGLALLDRKHGTFDVYVHEPSQPNSLPDDYILSLLQDRSGLLWVGTKFGGLAKWNPRNWSLGHHPASAAEGFASRNVMALTEDHQGRLWAGTFDGGIAILKPHDRSVATLLRHTSGAQSLSDDAVMALLTDREGKVWAGTMTGGLNAINPITYEVTVLAYDPADARSLPAPGVMSLFEDSKRRLWVGTFGGGLAKLDRRTGTFTRYDSDPENTRTLASDRVTSIAEDSSGLLWVGTDGGGLHVLDPRSGAFFRLRHDPENHDTLSADTVYCIHVDRDDRVWVGTRGGGLNLVVGSATAPAAIRFSHLTESNGLPDNTVYGIRSDLEGQLWVSTNFGLARVSPGTRKIRTYHRADGLQEEEFNFGAHYASSSGTLFFGGSNGFNEIIPSKLQRSSDSPAVVLTSILLPKKPPLIGAAAARLRELHLGYRDDDVTFEFAALDFTAPLSNRFQYQLEGGGNEWVDSGNRRTIAYSDLPGGNYVLRVRAANPDGVWNEVGTKVRLRVDPPPWRSFWAYTGYALSGVAIALAVWVHIRRRLERDQRHRNKLEQLVLERTKELAAHAGALEAANKKLAEASCTDPLTRLGNRRSLHETLPRLIAQLPRTKRLALMIADLDRLKPINDEFGHESGDRVLVEVSSILRQHLRETDTLVRWGGDEFILVHTCTDLDAAAAFAERMRSAISRHRFAVGGSAVARTSCSIGFALYPFIDDEPGFLDWEGVLRLSDAALYRAKRKRNAWVGWSGRVLLPDIEARLSKDAESAWSDRIIDARESQAATEETVELLLSATRARAAAV